MKVPLRDTLPLEYCREGNHVDHLGSTHYCVFAIIPAIAFLVFFVLYFVTFFLTILIFMLFSLAKRNQCSLKLSKKLKSSLSVFTIAIKSCT